MSNVSPYPLCRHLMPSGARCKSPALRGKLLCYYHSRNRTLVDSNRYRKRSVALPPLEDSGAIRIAIDEVLAAFAADKIDRRTVWPYLYAIQMASKNLARFKDPAPTEPVEFFEEYFEQALISDKPVGESDSPSTKSADLHLPSIDKSETHEYDDEPPDPAVLERLEKMKAGTRFGAFSSRSEANEFYKKEDRWLAEHFASQAAKAKESQEQASHPASNNDPASGSASPPGMSETGP